MSRPERVAAERPDTQRRAAEQPRPEPVRDEPLCDEPLRDELVRDDPVRDQIVTALGKLSESLETVERARGQLYAFHQLTGHADLALDEAVERLRAAGEPELAERIETELIGRNVLAGRWTFQVVEEYDDGYYRCFRELEQAAREQLVGGRRHLHEARMKQRRRTGGELGHEARPTEIALGP